MINPITGGGKEYFVAYLHNRTERWVLVDMISCSHWGMFAVPGWTDSDEAFAKAMGKLT